MSSLIRLSFNIGATAFDTSKIAWGLLAPACCNALLLLASRGNGSSGSSSNQTPPPWRAFSVSLPFASPLRVLRSRQSTVTRWEWFDGSDLLVRFLISCSSALPPFSSNSNAGPSAIRKARNLVAGRLKKAVPFLLTWSHPFAK